MLKGKTIILGISACIAAYKSATIVSRLKDLGADIWVIMTKEATQLIGPLTLRTLSGNPVIIDLFSQDVASLPVPHVALAQRADLIVIAPGTANIIGKLANGIADDALTTLTMDSTAPKVLAPAMNVEMWRNPAVMENVEKLVARGWALVGPAEGKLACGDNDIGRMSEPEEIVEKIIETLVPKQDLKKKHFLITAGGTHEALDPVRYISNRSSGKMGYALAEAARERGATVTLISANVDLPAPLDIKPIKVESADQMLAAVMKNQDKADVIIMAAAVADYKSEIRSSKSETKLKSKILNLKLIKNQDIIKTISKQKGRKGHKLVGFALETENLIKNAQRKLKEKGLDLIIANGPDNFGSDLATVTIIDAAGKTENLKQLPKKEIAKRILDRLF